MANALTRTLTTPTPQNRPLDERQVENSAGGYSYQVDKWSALRRFLILGTEGGTYYASERDLTVENMQSVTACVVEDPKRTVDTIVDTIVEISTEALAPRNTQAIYALAVVASRPEPEARQAANAAIGKVCRTGTHLFQFAGFMKAISGRGWGRGLRTAVARVFETMPEDKLALHSVKYRQREGWTHRDLMRLSHPKAETPSQNDLFKWLTTEPAKRLTGEYPSGLPEVIQGYWNINQPDASAKSVAAAIRIGRLPWETVPDQFRKDPLVWSALLENMPYTATMRNLATFARLGMLTPMGATERQIVERLTDPEQITKSRVHPMQILDAMMVHASGGRAGLSRGDTYASSQAAISAMDRAFHAAFKNVVPSGKRHYLALDVSGSMGVACAGSPVLSCRDGSAAMALVTAAVEPSTYVAGFTSGANRHSRQDAALTPLAINGRTQLQDAIRTVSGLPFGGTDCALPMLDALKQGMEVDVFCVYTDSETWAGSIHPMEALRKYRKQTGIDAKLVVVGMASNGFSIADPADTGAMDVVGFDASTPSVISSFARGDIG